MKHRQSGLSQELSANKAGFSVRSGRRIEKGERAGSSQRHWRTRKDPLEAGWDSELVPLLEVEPELTGESPRKFRRVFSLSQATLADSSLCSSCLISYSTVGIFPFGSNSLRLLNQSIPMSHKRWPFVALFLMWQVKLERQFMADTVEKLNNLMKPKFCQNSFLLKV